MEVVVDLCLVGGKGNEMRERWKEKIRLQFSHLKGPKENKLKCKDRT
jgi:hypothetical protein